MILTNQQILNTAPRLQEISQKVFPVKVSYAIAKNLSKIEVELKICNSERQKLVDKYSEKDEKGNTKVDKDNHIEIKKEFIDIWNKEFTELLDIENEIDIKQFKIEDLDGYALSASEIILIEYMIKDEEDILTKK